MRHTSELFRRQSYRPFCSLLITLTLVATPLPALADTLQTGPNPSQPAVVQPEPAASSDTTAGNNATGATAATSPILVSTPAPVASQPEITNPAAQTPTTADSTLEVTSVTPAPATLTLQNTVTSAATSGNAAVAGNGTAGNAASGNATAAATVLNIANANGATTPAFQTFQCDITGDSDQDVVIDPASLLPICTTTSVGANTQVAAPAQGLQTGTSLVSILNNISLEAISGNASASNNGSAGNATTGNATALATIANLANTGVTAKRAFLGVVNIFGNLKGDILVPRTVAEGLLGTSGVGEGVASTLDTTTIMNAVTADAQSGNASVSNNGSAGSAASGDAATSITVLNLTGQQVVAKNSLLVFVNVLGKWMGMIVPAPGSTTATLGSSLQGGSANTTDADGNAGAATSGNAHDSTVSITNNLALHSQSGNARVDNNGSAGSATTGSALAGANILNITNSNFQLDDWFGALFINVLGSWLGNFDIQAALANSTDNRAPGSVAPDLVQDIQVFQFAEAATVHAPRIHAASHTGRVSLSQPTPIPDSTPASDNTSDSHVLGASASNKPAATDHAKSAFPTDLLALAGLLIALTIFITAATTGSRRKLFAQLD